MATIVQTQTHSKPFSPAHTPKPAPPRDERATREQALKALTPTRDPDKQPKNYCKLGSRSGAVWHAIFAELDVPDELQKPLLFLAGYAKGKAEFEAYLGEVANPYYNETPQPNAKRDEKKRAAHNREQRFGALLDKILTWQQERSLNLVRYVPGRKVEALNDQGEPIEQSVRGHFHVPLLALFHTIYDHSKTTSAFDYVREAKIRDTTRKIIKLEFRDWSTPQRKTTKTLPRDKRIERERKKLLSRLKSLSEELDAPARTELWGEVAQIARQFDIPLLKEERAVDECSVDSDGGVYTFPSPFVENKEVTDKLAAEVAPLPSPSLPGRARDEFIAELSEQQREASSQRSIELYEASFSMADILAVNEKAAGGKGLWHYYRNCPSCGGSRSGKTRFNVNAETGGYRCHVCGVHGLLREHWLNPPVAGADPNITRLSPEELAARRAELAAQQEAATAASIERACGAYEASTPLGDEVPSYDAGASGWDYVQGRIHAAKVADACGVRVLERGSRTELVFPLVNQDGQIVAVNTRRCDGSDEWRSLTYGAKAQGAFVTPGALDARRVVIVEAPLCATALYAAGFDAIALCGTSWPDWLLAALEGREVLLGFDSDQPGDEAAAKLAKALLGRAAIISRLKPSLKDWAEIAQRCGLDDLCDEVASKIEDATGEPANIGEYF